MNRVKRNSIEGIKLKQEDNIFFRLLFSLSVMTVEQIGRMQPLTATTSRRAAKLAKYGFLTFEWAYDDLRDRIKVYRLGSLGLERLKLACPQISQKRLAKPLERNAKQMLHALLVSEAAVRITASVHDTNMRLAPFGPLDLDFYHTTVISDPSALKHVDRFATQHTLHHLGSRYSVRPDLSFVLKQSNSLSGRLYFLEIDRGDETHDEIKRKLLGYHAAQEQGRTFLDQYHQEIDDFRVLFVTFGARRLQNLLHSRKDTLGIELVRFTTMREFQESNAVFDLCWQYVLSSEHLSQPLARR